jgi:hypothetical protein
MPVPFDGRVSEAQLESWIVDNPQLVGEPLLVLGRQLAEFAEDQDRLDVLAIDEDGELVLIELKVADNFRVTDLQALAYAGAYASRDPTDLAQTLRRTLQKLADTAETDTTESSVIGTADQIEAPTASAAPLDGSVTDGSDPDPTDPSAPVQVTLDESKRRIVDFLELDDFETWQPSQHVRIKLVAPTFPRRVLKTVKWLGDVYNMPIEAIAVKLFSQGEDRSSLTFERLLPLADEGEFDMTVRRREERKRSDNTTRRPAIVPVLVREGLLKDRQRLWVSKSILRPKDKPLYDPDSKAFQVEVRVKDDGPPKFAWRSPKGPGLELLSPSTVAHRIYQDVTDWEGEPFHWSVAASFTITPDGQTLEQLAAEHGLWSSSDET